MKRFLLGISAVLLVSLNGEGCSDSSSHGGFAPVWQAVASMPDDNVTSQGFGQRENGEFVLAGGITDSTTGAMTSAVVFYENNNGTLNPVRTAFLPKAMIKPAIAEINSNLYIFDGGEVTARKPNPVRDVYRYDEANNSFITEAADPGFFFYNFAGAYKNQLFSLNPLEYLSGMPPGTQPVPATLQRFTPGSGWTSLQIQDFSQAHNVAVVGTAAYAFNGTVINGGADTGIYEINLDTGTVVKLAATVLPRDGGAIAIPVNGQIHLHGPGLDQMPEVFDPATGEVTVRSDLGAPEPLDWPTVVSGQHVFVRNANTRTKTVYLYAP